MVLIQETFAFDSDAVVDSGRVLQVAGERGVQPARVHHRVVVVGAALLEGAGEARRLAVYVAVHGLLSAPTRRVAVPHLRKLVSAHICKITSIVPRLKSTAFLAF